MATIRNMMRVRNWDNEIQAAVPADHLRVKVDVYGDGSCVESMQVFFADHSGLLDEFTAGDSTAVLQEAVTSRLDSLVGDDLTSAQRDVIGDVALNQA